MQQAGMNNQGALLPPSSEVWSGEQDGTGKHRNQFTLLIRMEKKELFSTLSPE